MAEATPQENQPPSLRQTATGDIDVNSLADLLEWFLNFDQRVALVPSSSQGVLRFTLVDSGVRPGVVEVGRVAAAVRECW